MDLSLTETQHCSRAASRTSSRATPTSHTVVGLQDTERGYSEAIWRTAAEVGWLGMVMPEAYGGAGGSFIDAAVRLRGARARAPCRARCSPPACSRPSSSRPGTEEQQPEQHLPTLARAT